MPWAVRLVFLFLLVDAGERVYELIALARAGGASVLAGAHSYGPSVPNLLIWVLVEPLLAVLLWFRTTWGRVWTQVVLAIHAGFLVVQLSLSHPEIWLYLEDTARLRLALSPLVDALLIALLFTAAARRWLDQ
ncbi:MAG: hypothetical protein D6731_06815 [Planctomycetota bacterium]|nr:MAG: hypothetical protein D6731_06815 [Planctomycetota bacterium]